jgi:hypothetical protein
VQIVYLDQNKWIGLARAAKHPAEHEGRALLTNIGVEVRAGRLVLPLTATNIYETYKINDVQRRHDLASLQAALSQGLVFRGRYRRLDVEIGDVVRAACDLPPIARAENWFLSDIFFEAFAEWSDERLPEISENMLNLIRSRPAEMLYDFLVNTPEDVRRLAVRKFSKGSDQLRQRIEGRRTRHANEGLSMRRRIYSALMMLDEIELILEIGRRAGAVWTAVSDIGDSNARKIVSDVPTYYIEREIALRIEKQNRPIAENDFRDMQTFCAVLAYADHVIAEKQFADLARQAGLDKKYGTRISTDLASLNDILAVSDAEP